MTKGATQVNEYSFAGSFGKYYWNGSSWETDSLHANPVGGTLLLTRTAVSHLPSAFRLLFS